MKKSAFECLGDRIRTGRLEIGKLVEGGTNWGCASGNGNRKRGAAENVDEAGVK